VSSLVGGQGPEVLVLIKIGQPLVGEEELLVCQLPQQEIAQPQLTAGSNEQVWAGDSPTTLVWSLLACNMLSMSSCLSWPPRASSASPRHTCKHYIRNSNRRHRSKTCSKAIVFDLEKQDVLASPRSATGLVEGKKEMIFFLACLN
jgi:hypothetical protein